MSLSPTPLTETDHRALLESLARMQLADPDEALTLQPLAGGVSSEFRKAGALFWEHAAGARIWDVDGNEYTDFALSQGPLTALRLEGLPLDPEKARHTPERGFIVTQVEVALALPRDHLAVQAALARHHCRRLEHARRLLN